MVVPTSTLQPVLQPRALFGVAGGAAGTNRDAEELSICTTGLRKIEIHTPVRGYGHT